MPFIPHTPESLIARSDSKNPTTTCKGITSSGRSCRRSQPASPQTSPTASPNGRRGVVVALPAIDSNHPGGSLFFCWQHSDQAAALAGSAESGTAEVLELKKRSSIDTLVGRLGVLDIEERGHFGRKRKPSYDRKHGQSLLMAVPEDPFTDVSARVDPKGQGRPPPRSVSKEKRKDHNMHFSFFCCMSSANLDRTPPPRVSRQNGRPQVSQNHHVTNRPIARVPQSRLQPPSADPSSPSPLDRRRVSGGSSPSELSSTTAVSTTTPRRPSLAQTPSSHTQALLALIPPTLTPQATSSLLAELAKPLTPSDREHGYIYIFWQTATNQPAPSPQTASSLLTSQASQGRRTSDALRAYGYLSPDGEKGEKMLMLKIGRASNVQRRLNEWSRQCGYNIALVRYYPHLPSTGTSSPSSSPSSRPEMAPPAADGPRKVPCVQRIERLIHLELAERKVRHECGGCGRGHREWFEVEASKAGIRAVDEVVKRWVAWGDRAGAGE